MSVRPSRILLIVLAAALLGVGVFGLLAARVTSMEKMDEAAAILLFDAVVDSLDSGPPRLTRDGSGRFTNSATVQEGPLIKPSRLVVMAYRSRDHRLVRSEIPFWFFRLKGPAAQVALKDSGFDMKRLGIRPRDIARQGTGLILDETFAGGDRILVWAE